jgi:SAM-dependent methyltransferase
MGVRLLWAKGMRAASSDGAGGLRRVGRLVTLGAGWIVEQGPGLDSFWLRTDAENWSISRFIKTAASQIPESSLIFDAGAGSSPYLRYLHRHRYQSSDIQPGNNVTFVADLHHLPISDRRYDAVICTQVLEHVQYPQKVLDELFRVLRPGGAIFLTAPQGWGLHQEPHHYFNFTSYGLQLLFRDAGFRDISINERGGILWYLGKRIRILIPYLYWQYRGIPKLTMFLFYLLSAPLFRYALPMTFFYLDAIDRKKGYTLGYACTCRKPL